MEGRISKIVAERGFGFIELDEEKDIFLHCSEVEGNFDDLREGDFVSFEVEKGPKGNRAVKVQKIKKEKTEEKEETT